MAVSEMALTAVCSRFMRASPSARMPLRRVILTPIDSVLFDRNSSILVEARQHSIERCLERLYADQRVGFKLDDAVDMIAEHFRGG